VGDNIISMGSGSAFTMNYDAHIRAGKEKVNVITTGNRDSFIDQN
jgi:hypothetical protein